MKSDKVLDITIGNGDYGIGSSGNCIAIYKMKESNPIGTFVKNESEFEELLVEFDFLNVKSVNQFISYLEFVKINIEIEQENMAEFDELNKQIERERIKWVLE